jgi:hypothetical protein
VVYDRIGGDKQNPCPPEAGDPPQKLPRSPFVQDSPLSLSKWAAFNLRLLKQGEEPLYFDDVMTKPLSR